MRSAATAIVSLALIAEPAAQPRLTLDYSAIARRIVQQLALEPGERVISIAHPGVFEDLVPHVRYEVMRAGGIDLGVVEVLREPVPESFDASVLTKGARDARTQYAAMFRDVDAAIMMPGADTSHPAYLGMQDVLRTDLAEHHGRRTVHFHWVENGSAYTLPGQPLPQRPIIDALYQRALLQTDYAALARAQTAFAAALRQGEVRVTSARGTDLRFRVGNRPITLMDGDASAARSARGQVLIDKEVELPAGVVRIAPLEETVEGVIVFPPSQWDRRPVDGLSLRFSKGCVIEVSAASGRSAVEAEMANAGAGAQTASRIGRADGCAVGRAFREFALGLNPLLAVPDREPWIPYYGYGAGVVRLSLGDNAELGGAVTGGYVRWNFFTDLTVTVGSTVWVRDGKLQAP